MTFIHLTMANNVAVCDGLGYGISSTMGKEHAGVAEFPRVCLFRDRLAN